MCRVVYREFLKATPRRTMLWIAALWLAFLVWGLVFLMGDQYLYSLGSASRAMSLATPEQVQDYILRAPPGHPLKGIACVLSPRLAPSHGVAVFSAVGILLMAILGAKLFGDEYAFGTIRRLWTEGPSRAVHLIGKVGALCLTVLAGITLTSVAALLLSLIVRCFYPIPWLPATQFPPLSQLAARFCLQVIASLATVLFLALLAGLVASATRSTLAGAVVGLLYILLGPETHLPGQLQPFLPFWHLKSLIAAAFPEFTLRAGEGMVEAVRIGEQAVTMYAETPLPGLVTFRLPLVGSAPSFAVTLPVVVGYLLLLVGLLHLLWCRQEMS